MAKKMTLREVMLLLTGEQKRALARRAGTSVAYLRKLSYGQCMPSLEMARRLIEHEPRLSYDSFERRHDGPTH